MPLKKKIKLRKIRRIKNTEKKKIDFKYNLKMYYSFLKKYKWIFILLLILIFILESTYIIDKFLFKLLIDNGTEFSAKTLIKSDFINILLIIAAIYIINIIIRSILKFINIHLLNHISSDMMLDLKRKFFNHIIHLDYNFHTTHKTGSLISRLSRGGGAIDDLTNIIVFSFAPLILQFIIVSISLIYFSAIYTLITLLTTIVFIIYSLFIQKLQKESSIKINYADDIEKANISDMFTNIESIKYFGKERKIKSQFKKIVESTKKAMLKNWDYYRCLDNKM